MLSDFGISRLVRNEVTVTGTTTFKFSSRWLAIELVEPSDLTDTVRLHTKKTDIWALGMVLYVSNRHRTSSLCSNTPYRKSLH